MDLIDEVIGYAKANAFAAPTADDQTTWNAHWKNCIRIKSEIDRLRAARDECERQYQEKVTEISGYIDQVNELRAALAAAQAGGILCTYGPPHERKRRWVLRFDDPDRGEMHFDDEGEAMSMFNKCTMNWTCTLFVTAEQRALRPSAAQADSEIVGYVAENKDKIFGLQSDFIAQSRSASAPAGAQPSEEDVARVLGIADVYGLDGTEEQRRMRIDRWEHGASMFPEKSSTEPVQDATIFHRGKDHWRNLARAVLVLLRGSPNER